MSPRKVDKKEKRREVAHACSQVIREVGMKNFTIAQVATAAGIGKGTVYEYFKNKEDIIFEIINISIEVYHNRFLESIKNVSSTKEKIKHFFNIVLDDDEETQAHFNGYKDFLSVVLGDENSEMKEFNCSTTNFFNEKLKEVVQEGIDKGELIPQAIDLSEGLLIFEKGLVLLKMSQNNYNVSEKFEKFINTIFNLIEIKGDKND
jgi:AcrR family transcriptional regulator